MMEFVDTGTVSFIIIIVIERLYYFQLNDLYSNLLMNIEYSNNPQIRAISDNRDVGFISSLFILVCLINAKSSSDY